MSALPGAIADGMIKVVNLDHGLLRFPGISPGTQWSRTQFTNPSPSSHRYLKTSRDVYAQRNVDAEEAVVESGR